jgi:hypothetical protein
MANAIDFRTGRIPVGMAGTVPRTTPASGTVVSTAQPVELPIRLYPPVNWENVDKLGYTTLGNIGITVTILQFQVPIGRNGIINKIANNFIGGGFQEGSGNIIYRILVDGGTPPGSNDYHLILGSLGSPASPTRIAGFRIYENQVVQFTATNVNITPAQQVVGARLMGYYYPRELEESDIWT